MYVTKAEREENAKTIRAVVGDVYKTPKYYEANDVILSPGKRYDSMLKAEMLSARKRLMEEVERYYSDKWVTGKELTKLYPCFSTSWLRQNGCYLPRTRATIYDDGGNEQNSKWGYSLNRIKKYIEQGYVDINYKRYYFSKDKTAFSVQWWNY